MVVSDRLGMPPMYMVVDIRWDDYAPEDEIVQMQDPTKGIFQNNNALPISPSRKRWALRGKKNPITFPLTACTRTTICSRPIKDFIWMIRCPISFWNRSSYFTFYFPIFTFSHFAIQCSHFVFPYSDSLLADRRAVQCGTAGCVKTTDNQVDQSTPS